MKVRAVLLSQSELHTSIYFSNVNTIRYQTSCNCMLSSMLPTRILSSRYFWNTRRKLFETYMMFWKTSINSYLGQTLEIDRWPMRAPTNAATSDEICVLESLAKPSFPTYFTVALTVSIFLNVPQSLYMERNQFTLPHCKKDIFSMSAFKIDRFHESYRSSFLLSCLVETTNKLPL